jgi:hypothetical protein
MLKWKGRGKRLNCMSAVALGVSALPLDEVLRQVVSPATIHMNGVVLGRDCLTRPGSAGQMQEKSL